MSFRQVFPVTAWCWRKLTPPPARPIWIGILLTIAISGIALRVEAALFQRRALRVVSALSSLQIGEASKAEALSRFAGFKVTRLPREPGPCDADECYSIWMTNNASPLWRVASLFGDNPGIYRALGWWGLRYWMFDASIRFDSGKVAGFHYGAWVGPSYDASVSVSAGRHIKHSMLKPADDQSPYYRARSSKLASLSIDIEPDTPTELVRHAFALRLDCVWSLGGCRGTSQLLPDAEQDRLRIERAAVDRLRGPDPCPEWILPHRVNDERDILLVEVEDVSPTFVQDEYAPGLDYRPATLRVLRVLKGEPRQTINALRVSANSWVEGLRLKNPDPDLLVMGRRLLLFSSGTFYSEDPCAVVAGTDSAVHALEEAIGASGAGATQSSTAPR